MVTSFVLVSSKACDVAQGYASAWTSPAASLDDHFEHPTIKGYPQLPSFLQPKPELKRLHNFRLSAIGKWMVAANKKRLPFRILLS